MLWDFKKIICYKGTEVTQDSRKFEILVELYLQEHYPLGNWKLTSATRDGNRDIESTCEFSGESMWAEAKYTLHSDKNLSSRKYDSTLVSSIFEKNLIKIYFVTNAFIGTNLIGRIRKYYYHHPVGQVAFVDGVTLLSWIKSKPDIETQFFNGPIKIEQPKAPTVNLKCIRILCMSDSYLYDSILEGEKVYPLYLSKNYTIEGDFIAFGFEKQPLKLYCNDVAVFDETTLPEILTFSCKINPPENSSLSKSEYKINIEYVLEGSKHVCGSYSIKFSMIDKIHRDQFDCYHEIKKGIKNGYKKIYNIWGDAQTGKSWIANNLKNDLLNSSDNSTRIIYINFGGNEHDIGDICRILFTLIFDYYNLNISAKTLKAYSEKSNIKNSFFSPHNIASLIDALQKDNYCEVQGILSGSIFSNTQATFEVYESFAYEKIYFIDNIHLLSTENKRILEVILKGVNPDRFVSFIITSREQMQLPYIRNIKIDYIDNGEILETLNEELSTPLESLEVVLPANHLLKTPRLLRTFVKGLNTDWTCSSIKNYYIHSFQENFKDDLKIVFDFNNQLLLTICLVKEGIPLDILLDTEGPDPLSELLNNQYIVQKNGYIYPNINLWNGDVSIPKSCQNEISEKLISLSRQDSQREEIYICALITNFVYYYNSYFPLIFSAMEEAFKNNDYYRTIFYCEALYKQKKFYCGEANVMCRVRYYMAFSYMHCDTGKDAKQIFNEILAEYEGKAKDDLYFAAKSEVIDFNYWSFNCFYELVSDIEAVQKEWNEIRQDLPRLQVRPYLTAQNRMMVTYLALDKMPQAEEWLQKNLESANTFHAPEHLGYSHMDYAKGIYHRDLPCALEHLQLADSFFDTPSEMRRHLDCQCEIQYVKLLLRQGSLSELLLAQEALFDHQYWIQFYKCYIKLAVVYALEGRNDQAKQQLINAESSDIINHSERVKYLTSVLGAYLYKEPSIYKNEALAGTSYYAIAENAKNVSADAKVVINPFHIAPNTYCIDPRAW